MRSWIDHAGEVVRDPAPALITQLVAAAQPFWLDIEEPTDEIVGQLATSLGLHPLAVENARQFGQRAKLQVYPNGVLLVGFGLDAQLHEPVEVHCYCTTGYLITLRRAPSPALDAIRQAGSVQPRPDSDPIRTLHPVITSLYTQFSALYLQLDQRLDELEQRVLREPDDELQQAVADLTAIEERCSGLLTLHASLASKHLAVVSRRLAAVATIFLPIGFLAGFWGQNFNVLTGSIERGWPAFLLLGVGLSAGCVLVAVLLLRRRQWN